MAGSTGLGLDGPTQLTCHIYYETRVGVSSRSVCAGVTQI